MGARCACDVQPGGQVKVAATVLREAADFLEQDEFRWTKCGQLAIDKSGKAVIPTSPAACAWCVLGAIERFSPRRVATWLLCPPAVALAMYLDKTIDPTKVTESEITFVVGRFNDRPDITLADAVRVLRSAAKEWELRQA